jgi:hypothetical protein
MNLCKYKNIFGEPNQGAHKTRIFGFALVDTIGTIIISFIIAKYYNIDFYKTLIIIFIIGEFFHYIFCVDTFFIKSIKNCLIM